MEQRGAHRLDGAGSTGERCASGGEMCWFFPLHLPLLLLCSPPDTGMMVGPLHRAGWRALKVRRGLSPLTLSIPSTCLLPGSAPAAGSWPGAHRDRTKLPLCAVTGNPTSFPDPVYWAEITASLSLIDRARSEITPRWFGLSCSRQRPLAGHQKESKYIP